MHDDSMSVTVNKWKQEGMKQVTAHKVAECYVS